MEERLSHGTGPRYASRLSGRQRWGSRLARLKDAWEKNWMWSTAEEHLTGSRFRVCLWE